MFKVVLAFGCAAFAGHASRVYTSAANELDKRRVEGRQSHSQLFIGGVDDALRARREPHAPLRLLASMFLVHDDMHAFGSCTLRTVMSGSRLIPSRLSSIGMRGYTPASRGSDDSPGITWRFLEFDDMTIHELYEVLELRQQVFVLEQSCLYPDLDFNDQTRLHLLGYEGTQLVAYARMGDGIDAYAALTIGRILVRESHRGRGLAKALIRRSIDAARQRHGSPVPVTICAQAYLQKFYRRLGFVPCSDVYDDEGVPHIDMTLTGDQPPVTAKSDRGRPAASARESAYAGQGHSEQNSWSARDSYAQEQLGGRSHDQTQTPSSQALPQGWTEHFDPGSGNTFYHCAETGETTWTRPDAGFGGRDGDSGYRTQDQGYGSRDRDYGGQDSNYGGRDQGYGSSDRGAQGHGSKPSSSQTRQRITESMYSAAGGDERSIELVFDSNGGERVVRVFKKPLGVVWIQQGPRAAISKIVPQSHGSELGLQVGWTIKMIDGEDVSRKSFPEAQQTLLDSLTILPGHSAK